MGAVMINEEHNLIQICRMNPRWASEEITSLRAKSKDLGLEVIRLKDDLRFATNMLEGRILK